MVSNSQRQIYCEKHCFLELENLFGDIHHIPCHQVRFGPGGLSFQCVCILAANCLCNVNISDRSVIVLDLIFLYHPSEVRIGWIQQLGVEFYNHIFSFGFPFGECFHVLQDCVYKGYVIFIWFILVVQVQSQLVHLGFHIWQPRFLPVQGESFNVPFIFYSIMFGCVLQGHYICDSFLAEPRCLIVSMYF